MGDAVNSGDAWFVEIGSGSMKWRIPAESAVDGKGSSKLERHSCDIGLSDGLDDDGRISSKAMTVLGKALADLGATKTSRGLSPPVVVASEALRRAHDGQAAVSDLVRQHLSTDLQILSPDEEGALALVAVREQRGATDEPFTVLDLGAASTEFVTASGDSGQPEMIDSVTSFSMPLGGRTVASNYLQSDPPDAGELSAALSVIELHLDDLRRERRGLANAISSGPVIGLGACVQIAAVEIGVEIASGPDPVSGYVLEHEAAEEIFRVLATEARTDRLHNPGLQPHHVDGVVGALCIVVELFRQFSIDSIEISTVDPVDGLAVGHIAGDAKLSL